MHYIIPNTTRLYTFVNKKTHAEKKFGVWTQDILIAGFKSLDISLINITTCMFSIVHDQWCCTFSHTLLLFTTWLVTSAVMLDVIGGVAEIAPCNWFPSRHTFVSASIDKTFNCITFLVLSWLKTALQDLVRFSSSSIMKFLC